MRALPLILASILASALLAGCSGSSDNGSQTGTSGPSDGTSTSGTGTQTGTTGTGTTGPAGNETQISCTVTAGASGSAYGSIAGNNVGGCVLMSGTTAYSADGTVVLKSMTLPPGCTSWKDSTPGDSMSEGPAEVGGEYEDGTQFGVYCDASMAPNSSASMVMVAAA